MAKSKVSDKWFVRVDGEYNDLKIKVATLASNIDTIELLAVYHQGEKKDNPHCHFVIHTSSTQKQSFAKRIKSMFEITERSAYAVEMWDGERAMGAVSYLFHEEEAEILVNKGFTDDEIELAKKANDAVQKVVKKNKERASNRLVDKCLEHMKETGMSYSKYDIMLYMITEIKNGNSYHPGEGRLKSFVEEVEIKSLTDGHDVRHYVSKLVSRLWRDEA